jgi:uncharacterized hydrophobic protein (TIGR00341 family)
MALFFSAKRSAKKDKQRAVALLLEHSQHHRDFYVLLFGAVLLAIGGIFADSIPVLIASMIVAPLAHPLLALGFGLTVGDWHLVGRTLGLLGVSCLVAITLAVIATVLFGDIRVHDTYVSFSENRYLATAVAVISGAIAAYGLVRPRVSAAITGVAIAVSLMPPLVATGIGFASGDARLATDAGTLFLLNVAGITVASVAVFSALGISRIYKPDRHRP